MSPEHPDLHAKPSASAPGSDPEELARIQAERGGVEGEHFKDVLEAEPERGGSKSVPDETGAVRQVSDEAPPEEPREG
jgi:hypothetical protein